MEPEDAYNRMVSAGSIWAENNAAAEALESTRHSVRSQLTMEYLPTAKTMKKSETMAEASQKYLEHLHAMTQARKNSNIAKVNYDALRIMIDLERTKESTRRAEIQNFRC